MKITLTEKIYTVDDNSYKRKFVYSDGKITIPGTHGNGLHFSNNKKELVQSFHNALGMFLEEIEPTKSGCTDTYTLLGEMQNFTYCNNKQGNVKTAEVQSDSNSPLIQQVGFVSYVGLKPFYDVKIMHDLQRFIDRTRNTN